MKKYYDNIEDNVAFERCIDVMAQLILKYGPQVLEKKKNPSSAVVSFDANRKSKEIAESGSSCDEISMEKAA
ncbi:MAG: hypothetical protein LUF28_01600 [Clostridiales bacterium]|nr:hypothetical protein [Clostridiales bacterium]